MSFLKEHCSLFSVNEPKELEGFNCGDLDIDEFFAKDCFDWQFQKASKYLPVRLSTTFFDGIGECIAFAANRADETTCDIT